MNTTSLAALAASTSSAAHSPNTTLMYQIPVTTATTTTTTSTTTTPSSSTTTTHHNTIITTSAEAAAAAAEGIDPGGEIRTEFYTREGLWKSLPNCEYVRQSQQQQPQQQQTYYNGATTGASLAGATSQSVSGGGINSLMNGGVSSNDPVKISLVAFASQQVLNPTQPTTCENCRTRSAKSNPHHRIDEDELDVVATDQCKSCSGQNSETGSLDMVIFNYAREIYVYQFTPFKSKMSETKGLIERKMYRSLMSTCHDVNYVASLTNTQSLQQKQSGANILYGGSPSVSYMSSSLVVAAGFNKGEIHVFDAFRKEASVFYNNNKLIDKGKVTCIKWLPNSVNLFLAAYSSGNIYLFDATCQGSSSQAPVYNKFYQSDSFSLHTNVNVPSSSGSGSYPSPSLNVTYNPVTRVVSSSSAAAVITEQPPRTTLSAQQLLFDQQKDNKAKQQSSSLSSPPTLNLLNTNQQVPAQGGARNPLLKWTIGPTASAAFAAFDDAASSSSTSGVATANTISSVASSNSLASSSAVNNSSSASLTSLATTTSANSVSVGGCGGGINGINEMAFSPCGQHLAVVSQDGYMRVFAFTYVNNQQMHVQLKCSMKSYFGGLLCVCWSPDGRYIATGGEDDLVTVYSFAQMRVACRGRGHSSWVNSCAFDPWARLGSFSAMNIFGGGSGSASTADERNNKQQRYNKQSTPPQQQQQQSQQQQQQHSTNSRTASGENNDDESDFEDYHTNQVNKLGMTNLTISTTSTKTTASSSSTTASSSTSSSSSSASPLAVALSTAAAAASSGVYYRLASCGQDNQLCFWDLTEDVLKEKTGGQSRSRVTSLSQPVTHQQLPQIVIQQPALVDDSAFLQHPPITHYHHHQQQQHSNVSSSSKHSSFVSSAKHLFSLKHNTEKLSKHSDDGDKESNGGESSSTKTSFFKRHKLSSSIGSSDRSGKKESKKLRQQQQQQQQQQFLQHQQQMAAAYSSSSKSNRSGTESTYDSGINTLGASVKGGPTKLCFTSGLCLNLCPKIDEVPMIEPLICKRIATERLTSLAFKEDCLMTATIDGFVSTWARPGTINTVPPSLQQQISIDSNKVTSTCL